MKEEDRESIAGKQLGKSEEGETTVDERWNMLWQLTIEEWAKKGIDIRNMPMRKDVVRLIRLQDK